MLTNEINMKCELCDNIATEKHHITYYPERTIGVCAFHGDAIHQHSVQYASLLQFKKNESTEFYMQQKRISKFLKYLSSLHRNGRK